MALYFFAKSLDKRKYMFKGETIMTAMLDAAAIKNNLLFLISKMCETPEEYVKNPGKDFARNRKLTFFGSLFNVFLNNKNQETTSLLVMPWFLIHAVLF